MPSWTKRSINHLGYQIVAAAIAVHKELGPGLLESVYEECMTKELSDRGFRVERQRHVPLFYKGDRIQGNLRLDLVVEDIFIVELKAVETMNPLFEAQLLTYLKLTNLPKGILINFNVDNITRNTLHLAGRALYAYEES